MGKLLLRAVELSDKTLVHNARAAYARGIS
jgi:hypothetical protein